MALVIGANGGIGSALVSTLVADGCFVDVIGLSRSSSPRLDLTIPASIEEAAAQVVSRGVELRLVIDATGVLEGEGCVAEKTYRQIGRAHV